MEETQSRPIQVRINCSLDKSLVTVTWPTRQVWTYRITHEGPVYLAFRSDPIGDWNPLEPNLLKMVSDKWAEVCGAMDKQPITFDIREKVGPDGLPLPELSDTERGLIWALLGMDSDRDGIVVASMDDVQRRVNKMVKKL